MLIQNLLLTSIHSNLSENQKTEFFSDLLTAIINFKNSQQLLTFYLRQLFKLFYYFKLIIHKIYGKLPHKIISQKGKITLWNSYLKICYPL